MVEQSIPQPKATEDQECSFETDPELISGQDNDSIHEDAEVAPKFIPIPNGNANILLKKTTLMASQIQVASGETSGPHNTLLDCILCKTVMIEPKECSKCRKGFCKTCIEEYVSDLIAGDYAVCCPNCSQPGFEQVDPHPILIKQLSQIMAKCVNAEKGCTEVITYMDIKRHQIKCDFAMIKCSNFGCEEPEMFQKDYPAHEASCEFKENRCATCDVLKEANTEHNCVVSMSKKYEILESKLSFFSRKLDLEIERNERNRVANDKGTQLMRFDIGLPAMQQIKFNPQYGWQQQITENIVGLPPHTRTILLKFGLTDLNIRREFASLTIQQQGSATKIDLTNYFMCGPEILPPFGQMTEILMPWDEQLESKLVLDFQVAPQQQPPTPPPQQMYGHPGNPYGGYQYQQMPPPQAPKHYIHGSNPYAYATLSIAGFQFKQ